MYTTTLRIGCVLAATSLAAALATAVPAQGSQLRHSAADPGVIVFGADATGSFQLYTVRGDGSGFQQITHLAHGDAVAPDWSPDGSHLIFELDLAHTARLAVVDADGGHLRLLPRLAPEGGATLQPSYGVSGKRIYYERYDGKQDDALFSASLAGRHRKRLTNPPDGYSDTDPNVSPDGSTLSFVRLGTAPFDSALMTLDLATGKVRQLTPYAADVAVKQSWAPNGKRIVFSRDALQLRDGISANVNSIRADGSRRRAVTVYSGGSINAFVGSYSPNGRWIVYREEHADRAPLMVIRPDGTGAHPILEVDGLRPRFIDWSTGPGVG
jgi:Tol biopolymer transport system component